MGYFFLEGEYVLVVLAFVGHAVHQLLDEEDDEALDRAALADDVSKLVAEEKEERRETPFAVAAKKKKTSQDEAEKKVEEPPHEKRPAEYVVQEGDTLYKIAMRFYGRPEPAMLIACEREALVCGERPDLRLTFDRDVRYRETDLRLDRGSAGIRLLPAGTVLMEIKTAGSMPLRLAHALDACGILPGSFSKYGTAYARSLESRAGCGAKPANAIVSDKKGETRHAVNL